MMEVLINAIFELTKNFVWSRIRNNREGKEGSSGSFFNQEEMEKIWLSRSAVRISSLLKSWTTCCNEVVVVVLGFYVPPTAKVIRRRDLGLKSHPKDCMKLSYLMKIHHDQKSLEKENLCFDFPTRKTQSTLCSYLLKLVGTWNSGYICSAQSRNWYNSGIVLRKVGILTLPGKVRIPTWHGSIPELFVRKVGIGTKWESTIFPAQSRNRGQSKNCIRILYISIIQIIIIRICQLIMINNWNIWCDWLAFMTKT